MNYPNPYHTQYLFGGGEKNSDMLPSIDQTHIKQLEDRVKVLEKFKSGKKAKTQYEHTELTPYSKQQLSAHKVTISQLQSTKTQYETKFMELKLAAQELP